MSKKTRPRRGPVSRSTAPSRTASRRPAGADDVGAAVEQMLSGLWAAVSAGDPLQAEIEAAICLSLPRIVEMDAEQAEAYVSTVLVSEAVRRWTPDGAAMLRLLMTLGPPAVKKEVSPALARLTAAGVYPPDWVTGAGRPVPGQAWRRHDVFGDDEAIVVTFRYGEAEHAIFAQVNLTGIPAVTAAGLAADTGRLIEAIRRADDPFDRVEQIGLAEARARLDEPLARCEREPDPELSVDTLAALPIVRSRVRRLPAEGAPRVALFTASDRAAAVDEFMKSPLAADAVAADEESTRFWAEVLTGYSGRIPGEPPAQVGRRKMVRILLEHVPNMFVLSAARRQHLEPAVTAWTRWSAAYRGLDEAAAARLTESLPTLFGLFDEAYDDQIAVASRSYAADLATGDVDMAWLTGQVARRMFALPMPKSADDPGLRDVSDPAERHALAAAEFADCVPPNGMTSEQFVAAADRIISELWDGDPAGTFEAAGRLVAGGASRHDAIHTLAAAR